MHNQILRNVVVCTTPAVCNVPYLGWEACWWTLVLYIYIYI